MVITGSKEKAVTRLREQDAKKSSRVVKDYKGSKLVELIGVFLKVYNLYCLQPVYQQYICRRKKQGFLRMTVTYSICEI